MTLETPIERMYRAGKGDIPNAASQVSEAAFALSPPVWTCNVQAAHAGDPELMRDMLEVLGLVHEALRRATQTLNNCATSMIATADDYVATDDRVRGEFASLDGELKDGHVPEAPVPGHIGSPEDPGATREVWPDAFRPGIPIEDQSRTEEHESTPDPGTEPEDDLDQRDDEADANEPDLPSTEPDR